MEGGNLRIPSLKPTQRPPTEEQYRVFGRMISHKVIKNAVVRNILKGAWARFGAVTTIEVDDRTMRFDFASIRDRDQILDSSPWSVQGHSLNLRMCDTNLSTEDIKFNMLAIWIQINGFNLQMLNTDIATNIGNSIGRCFRWKQSIR